MADKRQWKDLMKEYPLLWHPKHPHFGDEDLKMIYRERLLERCNKECEPIDMETLKQRLAGFQLVCSWSNVPFKTYLRKDKPTPKEVREQIYNLLFTDMAKDDKMLELAAAFPCLWQPNHVDYGIEKATTIALYELQKQCNEQSETPIGKEELKAKMDGFKKRLFWRSREVTIEELQDNRLEALAQEFPCIWNPKGPRDLKIYDESCLQLLNMYNTGVNHHLTMDELITKVDNLKLLAQKRLNRTVQIDKLYDDDRIEELAEAFPALWNPLLPEESKNYDDSYVKLLDQYNTGVEHHLTMNELRDKVDKLKSRLVQKHLQLTQGQIDKIHDDKFEALAREYPCLLEPLHPDYKNLKKKDESYVQLFAKYNTGDTKRLTMEELIFKVGQLKSRLALRRTRTQERPQKILVLSQNQTETHTTASSSCGKSQDSTLSQKQIEEQTASNSSSDKRPQNISVLAQNQTAAPTTSDPSSDKSHQIIRIRRKVTKTIDLTRDIRDESIRMLTENQSKPRKILDPSGNRDQHKKGINPFMDLAAEFPCLWNPKDINYMDKDIKERCWNQLLEKYNKHSSFVITMAGLKERIGRMRLNLLRRNRYYIAKGRSVELVTYRHDSLMELLAKEFPSLWDPQDINYGVNAVQERCYEQLLEICNNESSVPITMEHLIKRVKVTIRNYVRRGRFSEKNRAAEKGSFRGDRLMELAKEFPCLWDPQDINYGVKATQDRCYEQLLEKYNSKSGIKITMEHLVKRVKPLHRNYMRLGYAFRFAKKKKQHNGEISEGRSQADTEAGRALGAPQSAWQDDSSDDNEPLTSLQKMVSEVGSKQQPSSAVAAASDVVTQVDACLQPAAMAGGTVQVSATQQAPVVIPGIEIHFNWCCFCGEIKDDCHNLTIEKPYISTSKTLLTLNDLSVVLDFSKDTTPKSICRNCDTRLYDIVEFIKSVKKAQEKFSHESTVDDFRENVTYDSPTVLSDNSESNEGFKNVMDFLSYTDAEFVKETNAFKRKTDENKSKPKKKCRVSIDLNSCTLPTFCDDINGSYDMESNVRADSVAVTNEESSNNTSANNTQDTINEDITESAISNAVLVIKEEIIEPNNDAPNEVIPETPSELQEAASRVSFEEFIIGAGVDVSKGVNLNFINDVETLIVIENNDGSDTEIASENAVSSKSSGVILESVLKDANSLEVIRSKTTTKVVPNYKTTNAIEDAKILLLNEYNEVFIKEESNEMTDSAAQIEPQLDCTESNQSEEKRDSEVVAGNIVRQLAGSIDSLVSDKEVTQEAGPSNLTKEPSSNGALCVMPKSDLILLVESIVSRMLNK